MLEEPKYQLIKNFNLKDHKQFYLDNLKYHHETISASHRQLQLTYDNTY